MEKSLLETNPYLKDPELRRKMLDRSFISSSAIEGIHITEEDLQRFREERALEEACNTTHQTIHSEKLPRQKTE